jgi:hypothetical protein
MTRALEEVGIRTTIPFFLADGRADYIAAGSTPASIGRRIASRRSFSAFTPAEGRSRSPRRRRLFRASAGALAADRGGGPGGPAQRKQAARQEARCASDI